MTRWLLAVLAALVVIGAGWLVFLNQGSLVGVRLTPTRTQTAPLALALLAAFAAGGLVVGLVAGTRAGARGWRRWQAERRARRAAARAAATTRAERLLWAGDYTQARRELLREEDGAPKDTGRLALLAETHLAEGDATSARRVLEDGIARLGAEPRLLDLLAEAAERTGDLPAAAAALERARQALPESPRLARRLRDVYTAAGRWPEALALEGEIMLGVRDPAVLAAEEAASRGLRYEVALGEPDPGRAGRLLAGLAREDPGFVPAWVSAGERLLAAGRRLAGRWTWERGARRTGAAVLLERLEALNAEEGRPERTSRLYRRCLRARPEAPAVRLLFARHLIARNALDEAEQVLSGLPAPASGHRLTHALFGEIHRRRGNHSLAAETYARAFGTELGLGAPLVCAACRQTAATWAARCAGCGRWGTYRAAAERTDAGG